MATNVGNLDVPVEKATQQLQIRVRVIGLRRFQARLYCAQKLLQLAGVVSPLPLEVELVKADEDQD